MNNSRDNRSFRHILTASTILGMMFSAVLFNTLHTKAGFDINLEFDVGCEEAPTEGEGVEAGVPTGLPPGAGPGALPEEGAAAEGEGAAGAGSASATDCPKTCKVMFDTYLLNARVWENRVNKFANAMFKNIVDNLTQYAYCFVGKRIEGIASFIGGSQWEIVRAPECELGLTAGDIGGMAEDAAKRTLLYDNIVRCQSRDMLNKITEGISFIANTNGRDGGETYVRDFTKALTNAENRGRKIALNNMANTRYCPWIQEQMEAIFGFSKAEARPLTDNTDNGAEPYTQRAECSFPPGTTAEDVADMPEGTYLLGLPSNNLLGAYLMAQEEMDRQIGLAVTADSTDLISNNGNFGSSGTNAGESCLVPDGQNGCLQYAPKTRTGTQVENSVENAEEAELNWLITSNKMGQLMGNTVNRILNRAVNFTRPDIRFDFTPDQAQKLYSDSAPDANISPTPQGPPPTGSCSQTCGCPADEPVCQCMANTTDEGYSAGQQMVNAIKPAIGAARLNNPQLFVGGNVDGNLLTNSPNCSGSCVDDFVVQVCFELNMSNFGCRPYLPRAADVILIPAGDTVFAIDIVTAAGKPRTSPTAKYSCEASAFPGL